MDIVPDEIDLHGYDARTALARFLECYNLAVRHRKSFVVIHGYGSSGTGGVIRSLLRNLLEKHPDKVVFVPGEKDLDRNSGCTRIDPILPLPTIEEQMLTDINDYCTQPKSEEKIVGRFNFYGAPEIKKAIKTLVKEKRLKVVWKGKYKCFQAVR